MQIHIKSNLQKLQVANNKILRVILNKPLQTALEDLYSPFKLLSLSNMHKYQLLKLVHTWMYNKTLLPSTFDNYFELATSVHGFSLRNCLSLQVHSVSSSIGGRNIKILSSKLWNTDTKFHTISNSKQFNRELYEVLKSEVEV